MLDKIIIRGAREHNLKNINLELPKNKLIVFTGLSGSGKSSLAFDTIFAEGQRRYVESLSAYARQFLGQMDKPDVDEIEGLSPAISIDQKAHSANPRSTVATITEIYDYLRVLFARIGKPHCVVCKKPISKLTVDEMADIVTKKELGIHEAVSPPKSSSLKKKEEGRGYVTVLAPAVRGRKGEYYQLLYDFLNAGYSQARVDGKARNLRERITLSRYRAHTIELVVDRVPLGWPLEGNKNFRSHLYEAIENALKYGNGVVTILLDNKEELIMSSQFSCPDDGFSFPEIEPRLFSFNSPYGACEQCHGLGTEFLFSETLCPKCRGARLRDEPLHVFVGEKNIVDVTRMTIADAYNFFTHRLCSLGAARLNEQDIEIAEPIWREISNRLKFMFDVGLDYLTLNRNAGSLSGGEAQRIRLASQIGSRLTGTLYVLDEPTIGLHQKDNEKLIKTLEGLRDLGNTIIVVEHDEDTIRRSDHLVDIGSGAGKAGGHIIVSEPTEELLKNPKSETPVVERFALTTGQVRNPKQIQNSKFQTQNTNVILNEAKNLQNSLTLQYLLGQKKIDIPKQRRKESREKLKIIGAAENNLKNINVEIPLKRFVCVTGVSGSGKSTLIYDCLYRALAKKFYRSHLNPGKHKMILGLEHLDRVVEIDQSPIGRTPRSNPATYTGVWTYIRDLFTATEEARMRGWKPGRFSFNVPGGRCERCQGHGSLAIEMHFLPTVYIGCDVCKGKRFDKETLEVKYKGKNISEILRMTIDEADGFFRDIPMVHDKFKVLREVGLGYLELGQSATTLSGGEAQRVKLAAELGASPLTERRGRSLYLFDEPTVGLHFEDVKKLIEVLQRLVSLGNSVVVIEHNLDIVKCADWIIDLGPEGGDKGGEVVAVGTPEEVARKAGSWTGKYLRRVLIK